jgi:hypothetical protein
MNNEVKSPFIIKTHYKTGFIWMQYFKPETNELFLLTEKNGMFTILEVNGDKKITTSKDKTKIIGMMHEIEGR